jgi:hypothetical protein
VISRQRGRSARERGRRDAQMLFQVSLEVRYERGFPARPALRRGGELHDTIASLQYRHVCEYAVGHGVARTYAVRALQRPDP